MRQKHRTSWPQTSVLSRQNLGCLSLRSPMFSFFRPEIVGKPYKCASETLMLHFCDISNKDFPVGFRRPSQAVTDTSKAAAWRLPERRKKNCTLFHTQHFSSWIFFNTIPEMTSARHTVEPPFSVLKTGNRKKSRDIIMRTVFFYTIGMNLGDNTLFLHKKSQNGMG